MGRGKGLLRKTKARLYDLYTKERNLDYPTEPLGKTAGKQ